MQLVSEVTRGFRGDVGVVPRQFLREFVNQLDLVDDNPEYDPATAYESSPAPMTDEESAVVTGSSLAPAEGDDGLVPKEDVW